MSDPIMVGCDLHDKTMLLKLAHGRNEPETLSVANTRVGRARLIAQLQERAAGGVRVILAYEASGLGFGWCDQLRDAGIECAVLAPTKITRTPRQQSNKTDERDAQALLELLRGHVLAGNELPSVWIPDAATRDDRELVRARLDLAEKQTALKTQLKCLLKRRGVVRPESSGTGWSKRYRGWLQWLTLQEDQPSGWRQALASLLRQLNFVEQELQALDAGIEALAKTPRYVAAVTEMNRLTGVGLLTAMVFLSEIGDVQRFANRRELSAYLGLVPKAGESGTKTDRKGHITRQGPSRVRRVLCQAAWARVRWDSGEEAAYERIVSRNPRKKKIAVVAVMRRLAVRMWHKACEASGPPAKGSACNAPAGEGLARRRPNQPTSEPSRQKPRRKKAG
jgi:transposase